MRLLSHSVSDPGTIQGFARGRPGWPTQGAAVAASAISLAQGRRQACVLRPGQMGSRGW